MNNKLKEKIIGALCGLIIGGVLALTCFRGVPVESVRFERDTVVQYDTVPAYFPIPKDSSFVKWMAVKVPSERVVYNSRPPNDSIRVDTVVAELPVTQKHYQSEGYQAWVSGVAPNLDSIEVYQKTQFITEKTTIKESKHFFLGFAGGGEYFNKNLVPFAEVGATFKTGKFSTGVAGGYHHYNNSGEPYVRIKLSYDIISF